MLRRPLSVVATVLGAGCDAAGPVPEFDATPTLAALIAPGVPPLAGNVPPDSGQYALLVTTGTPIRSPYLRADRFEMRRVSDGARFAWRAIDPAREAIGVALGPDRGNYFLPRAPSADGLGSDSITPGEVYELVAEAGPYRVVGRTRVPGAIQFVRSPTDGDSIIRWRRIPDAGGYATGGHFYASDLRQIADTALLIRLAALPPGARPEPMFVRIFAFDSNFVAMRGDRVRGDFRLSQAGVTGGWGVFGSYTWADTDLPPRTASATPP